MPRPDLSRVPEYYHQYVNKVTEDELVPALKKQSTEFLRFLNDLPESKRDYRYAPGKWTIKEMLQHILDGERVFAYRSLCFARKDANSLPGFDENDYAANAKTENRNWEDLVKEFTALRQSTEILFSSFDKEQLESAGIANGKSVYVLAIGFVIVGHINHHIAVLKERYLP
jgi:hypothetical protein